MQHYVLKTGIRCSYNTVLRKNFVILSQFFILFHKTKYLSGGCDNPLFEAQKELK